MKKSPGPPIQNAMVDVKGIVTQPWAMFFQKNERPPIITGLHLERVNSFAPELQMPGSMFCEADRMTFYLRFDPSSPIMTAVNQDSPVAGTTLYVPSTQGFWVGQLVFIGQGTAREEVNVITAITPNVSFTLIGALGFTHTAVQADRVTASPRTYVDANSASGAPTLNVSSTLGFVEGQTVLIAPGTERQERRTIQAITAGVSLTLSANLSFTHTAAQADRVGLAPQWVYVFGTMRDILANRPVDLGPSDNGFLFQDEVTGITYRWDGLTLAWVLATMQFDRVVIEKYGSAPILDFLRSNGTVTIPTAVLDTETLGRIEFDGRGATGYHAAEVASIEVVAAEDFSDSKGGTHLIIKTTPKTSVTQAERIRVTSEGLVGINDTTPSAQLDVAGQIRSTAFVAPVDGEGLEMHFTGMVGYVQAYDRLNSDYHILRVSGLQLILNAPAASGNVLVKHAVDNAAGGVLQVKGDVTPDVDGGGDLGTTGVRWNDIRYTGSVYLSGTEIIDVYGNGHFYKMYLSGLTDYANNAAALLGGKVAGEFYTETGTDPKRVCVVY